MAFACATFNYRNLAVVSLCYCKLRYRVHERSEESPDSTGQRIRLTAGLPGNGNETVPQKITACLARVKTWGKSPRLLPATATAGKPCVLKCHV
jgi:hypothetical protein